MSAKFVLLNSFDRSGSTLISKALSQHPEIENLFNPFNASVFRREFMQVWNPQNPTESQDEGEHLVRLVLEGDFSEEHIKSRVFFPHSSTQELRPEALHVIKTTNFHTKIHWFKELFPSIKVMGLIRSPIAILASLVRNDFHREWYGGWAYEDLVEHIQEFSLPELAVKRVLDCTDEIEQMACIIGCLNSEMLLNLDAHEIIKYEDVINNPNVELKKILKVFNLQPFDFAPYFSGSVNSSGKQFGGHDIYSKVFTSEQIHRYSEIFKIIGSTGYEIQED